MSTEPEIRIDQLTGMRTILAAARSERPIEFDSARPEAEAEADCPFCGGHEDRTPSEVWAERPGGGADSEGWTVRSVPNLYPAVGGEDSPEGTGTSADAFTSSADPLRASARSGEPELFSSVPASGAHEVIVHTPEHLTSLADLGTDHLYGALAGWRARMQAHPDAAYCQLIVNEGPAAGASREHTHAQLYALGFVPPAIARERERVNAYFERTNGGALLSDIAAEEVRRKDRLVAIDDEAMLLCPWASRSPYELRLVPRRPAPSFERDEGGAEMLASALKALEGRFGTVPQFNLWVVTAPRGADRFHWHLDLVPRFAVKAGFEFATGVDINIYPPERAAAELREALS